MLLQQARALVNAISKTLRLISVGSVGRGESNPADLDFITKTKLDTVLRWFQRKYPNLKIKASGERYLSFVADGHSYNIWRFKTAREKVFMRFARLATQKKNIIARKLAKDKNLILTDKDLTDLQHHPLTAVKTEKGLYNKLGMTYRSRVQRYF